MKERLIYDTLIIDQSFYMEVIMKKALIIVFIMCLLGMIFLSGSIGVFFEPVEVFNKAIVVAILIIAFIICCLYRKNKKRR